MNLCPEGEFQLWLNKEGRDLLVKELLGLSEHSDHFHMSPREWGEPEVELSTRPYHQTDKLISVAKVMFRTDEMDRKHFPHVLNETE